MNWGEFLHNRRAMIGASILAAADAGVDVYYKQLENVVYGGRRPARG